MAKNYILTKSERAELEKEYRHLIDVETPENVAALQLARSQGDLSENADYDAARDRQAQIAARIADIEDKLNNSIDADSLKTKGRSEDLISIGDTVTFIDKSDDTEYTVKVGGNAGANPLADVPVVSNESPLGRALLDKVVGQIGTVQAEEPYEVEIVSFIREAA